MAEPMSVMNLRPKRELVEEIAQIMGIAQSFVEKDWDVVHIIALIAEIRSRAAPSNGKTCNS